MSEEIKEIPENVREMADKLKETVTVDENVISFEDNAFKNNLPSDVKYKLAKRYEKHKVDFSAAVHLAAGEIGNDIMAKDEDVIEVNTLPLDMIYSKMSVQHKRKREGVSKMSGESVPWVKYGIMNTTYTTNIDRKTGSVGIVKAFINNEAKKMFGDDS